MKRIGTCLAAACLAFPWLMAAVSGGAAEINQHDLMAAATSLASQYDANYGRKDAAAMAAL
jgi:hypothetical protein